MKLSLVCLFLLVVSFLVTPEKVMAQSSGANAARQTSEQSLQELVREVRQLRAALQQINTVMYRGQVMLERLKLQQDQVTRMSRELAETRENLHEIRSRQMKIRELLNRAEAGVEVGFKHPNEVAGLKQELDTFRDREHRLAARETQLTNDLEMERARLNELNERLNALESEMAPK